MTRGLAALLYVGVLITVLPVRGAAPKQSFEVTSTERVDFRPGGTIRLNNSYGYLTVEGWDEPAAEVTLTKSTDWLGEPDRKSKADRRFEQVRVVTERRSDTELAISTTLPHRNSLFTSVLPSGEIIVTTPLPPNNKRGVTVECRVRVPRDSRLVVHQDNGYVYVSDLTGDIEVHSHTGDMMVTLPDPGPYSIDARTGVGSVSSDYTGRIHRYLLGTHFIYPSQAPSRRVHLRMGRGSITIKKGPLSGPLWK